MLPVYEKNITGFASSRTIGSPPKFENSDRHVRNYRPVTRICLHVGNASVLKIRFHMCKATELADRGSVLMQLEITWGDNKLPGQREKDRRG